MTSVRILQLGGPRSPRYIVVTNVVSTTLDSIVQARRLTPVLRNQRVMVSMEQGRVIVDVYCHFQWVSLTDSREIYYQASRSACLRSAYPHFTGWLRHNRPLFNNLLDRFLLCSRPPLCSLSDVRCPGKIPLLFIAASFSIVLPQATESYKTIRRRYGARGINIIELGITTGASASMSPKNQWESVLGKLS